MKDHIFDEFNSLSVVYQKVFPHVATGFSDTTVCVREQTLKSMLVLAPKMQMLAKQNKGASSSGKKCNGTTSQEQGTREHGRVHLMNETGRARMVLPFGSILTNRDFVRLHDALQAWICQPVLSLEGILVPCTPCLL